MTVHVAIGTDTIHAHPEASGQALGETTYQDFRLFCTMTKELDGGGVYLNVGLAVVLPEVFLKAYRSSETWDIVLKNSRPQIWTLFSIIARLRTC